MKNNKICLNPETTKFSDESIIDLFTSGLGGYCGSFCIPTSEVKRYLFALNTINSILYDGKTSALYRIAVLRKNSNETT